MKVSVIGVGYVGLVAAACLAEDGNDVVCMDMDSEKIDGLKNGRIPIYEPGLEEIVKYGISAGRLKFTTDLKTAVDASKIIFLAVGTPSSPDGSADISAVLKVSEQIAELMTEYKIIVTKSTVPVGTHKEVESVIKARTDVPFDYVSNPEFLKEGAAVDDFQKPDRVIIGTNSEKVREVMAELYAPLMRRKSRVIYMDPASAEMAKYASNTMLATRISFMNELSMLCEKFGADIEMVRHGVGSDSRIGSAFLFAGIGYGGSCFPKDVDALIYMGNEQGTAMTIAQAVRNANQLQRQRFAQKIIDYYKDGDNVKLAVWGLAFKARTDDTRESPAIFCIEKFAQAGMKISAYDPEVEFSAVSHLDGDIEVLEHRDEVLADADGLVVFTDWQEFRSPDFELIAKSLKRPVIFDGRNLYKPQMVRGYGIEYHSIGRS